MTDSGAAVAVPEIREITTVEQTFAAAEVLRKVWGEEHPGMDSNWRLAREEALFTGTSTGANVVAALRVAERLGPERVVATLACDSGLKYLSTDLYASS